MSAKAIAREKIPDAVSLLKAKYRVIAPVQKGKTFVFKKIDDPQKVVLDYNTTILPLKKFFLPPSEVLVEYNLKKREYQEPEIKSEPTVFFGIHNYELQGILRLDYAFGTGVKDETYLKKRENNIFIGVTYTPDDYHFAESVGIPTDLKEGFDIFLTKYNSHYRVEALTDKGKNIVSQWSQFLEECSYDGDPVVHFKNKLKQSVAGIREIFHGAYNHPVWKETSKKCYSCGTCNLVCPTCYCFDVSDEVVLGTDQGTRSRRWDSCQILGFTEVAGGEAFREKRYDRVRHRMSRKFAYIMDDKDRPFCVGCGRCIRQCTANISITDVMNALL